MIIIKLLRRLIIGVCLILLGVKFGVIIFNGYEMDKYYENIAKENNTEIREIKESMDIDGDKITLKSVFSDKENIYIGYKSEGSHGTYGIRAFDDSGKEYFGKAFSGTWSLGGVTGVITLTNIVPEDTEYITLKIDWYDSKDEVKIWLKEEGEANES